MTKTKATVKTKLRYASLEDFLTKCIPEPLTIHRHQSEGWTGVEYIEVMGTGGTFPWCRRTKVGWVDHMTVFLKNHDWESVLQDAMADYKRYNPDAELTLVVTEPIPFDC